MKIDNSKEGLYICKADEGFEVGLCELLKSLKMDCEPGDEDYELVSDMAAQAAAVANPKAVYRILPVTGECEDCVFVDGVKLESRLVKKCIGGKRTVYPYVCSCGRELGDWAAKFTDPLEEYIADGIMVAYFYAFSRQFGDYMDEKYFAESKRGSINPGSLKSWPIERQRELFGLIGDVEGAIGVRLTESFLMLPSKSGSGIFFESNVEYHNCAYCPRASCPNRRAEFTGEMIL